jgi:hypothetical protein
MTYSLILPVFPVNNLSSTVGQGDHSVDGAKANRRSQGFVSYSGDQGAPCIEFTTVLERSITSVVRFETRREIELRV